MTGAPGARRRFWDRAEVVEEADGFAVRLDGRPVRLPGGTVLRVGGRALAEALAGEWRDAAGGRTGGEFTPSDLPLTRMAGTMLERIAPDRAATIGALLGYARHELLCYRARYPALLVERQRQEWDPWLDWLRARHGVALRTTDGVMPVDQPDDALAGLRAVLDGESDGVLAALGVAVPALGSLVLGLALVEGRLTAEQAIWCATLDERTQMELWGADAEQAARLERLRAEVADAASFLVLLRPGS
ncbi:ATP12 family chaperone protein [Gluconacetobacter sacchari]|uniref:ATP synthase F1 mitochondrial assembly chaperone ATP12 n=1 Tax=Gluconacetobacter sacchari DSM 12717 TaxID=1307940 RepID=A0ABQ0PCC6_9PROT|nr:ATP synthase F1 mitochondrial assembly chaperone ATP12 [Gluconacetobacter sacchari DSM 12717]